MTYRIETELFLRGPSGRVKTYHVGEVEYPGLIAHSIAALSGGHEDDAFRVAEYFISQMETGKYCHERYGRAWAVRFFHREGLRVQETKLYLNQFDMSLRGRWGAGYVSTLTYFDNGAVNTFEQSDDLRRLFNERRETLARERELAAWREQVKPGDLVWWEKPAEGILGNPELVSGEVKILSRNGRSFNIEDPVNAIGTYDPTWTVFLDEIFPHKPEGK